MASSQALSSSYGEDHATTTSDDYQSSDLRLSTTDTEKEAMLSFCKLKGNTGLHPSTIPFDSTVIKRLDNLFDDTQTEIGDEERLKTFLRIRPTAVGADAEVKSFRARAQRNKVLEIKDDTTVLTHPVQKTVNSGRVHGQKRNKATEFKFTKVLGPECGQKVVFEECVNPLIDKFLRKENCLIFTYGATNSGKTYTLQGRGTDYGIIPRTLESLFCRFQNRIFKHGDIKPHLYQTFHHLSPQEQQQLQQKKEEILTEAANIKNELVTLKLKQTHNLSGSRSTSTSSIESSVVSLEANEINEKYYALYANDTMFSIWVSFAELYNEKVYDLLEPVDVGTNRRRKDKRLVQDKNGYVYVKDLTELHVTSEDEAFKIFLAGRKNLQFAATQMNESSSRSHSFFTIRVVSIGIGQGLMPYPKSVHRMTFCDLAGMERASQTENEGVRLKESSNINSSLTCLLRVIRLLWERQRQAHGMKAIETIPFRESKLTHIFKSYLTSSTHICMIVNVNGDPKMADSTLQVLNNSAIASNVISFRPMEPEQIKKEILPMKTNPCFDKENINPLKPSRRALNKNTSVNNDQKANKKVQFAGSSSSNDSDSENVQTVVSMNKMLMQQIAALHGENRALKLKLDEAHLENQRLRDRSVKMIAEQNRLRLEQLNEYRLADENIRLRKLSLMTCPSRVLSPGTKCRWNTPPRLCMDNIPEYEDGANNEEV